MIRICVPFSFDRSIKSPRKCGHPFPQRERPLIDLVQRCEIVRALQRETLPIVGNAEP